MTNFNDFLNEQMKDPEFKAEWDAQTDISKLERGNGNPSLRTLQRLAAGMGMRIKIEFVPAK